MKINNKYNLEDKVYLVTDMEQYPRMVLGITLNIGGVITYLVGCSDGEPTTHYECELSDEKNVIGDIG